MDMAGALLARALADSTVNGIIVGRAYWMQRIQAEALPAVTFQGISDPRPQHLKGFNQLRETRVQGDCWALTHLAAFTLAEALIAALVPENTSNGIIFNRSIVDDVRDLGERTENAFIHRASIDFRVFWQAE